MPKSAQDLNMKPIIVIPAYEPTPALTELAKELTESGYPVLIVNDGSSEATQSIFTACRELSGVTLVAHAINLGKGQALKTAFNYILTECDTALPGVITADADGQHRVSDVIKLADRLCTSPNTLWIGSRAFDKDVPFRSKFGNTLTRHVFRLLVGKPIQDTQSGLRGIPRHFLAPLLRLKASRYEFELDMLVEAATQHVPIQEEAIETIYLDHNASSHFRPLVDSLKVYFVFIRFCGLSLATALLDFVVFSLAFLFSHHILLSFFIARLIAGTFNFVLGKRWIFQSKAKIWPEALKFSALVLFLMGISYALVYAMVEKAGINVLLSKVVVEGSLFLLSFAAQRLLVFNHAAEGPLEIHS